jgi:hypothetical protein
MRLPVLCSLCQMSRPYTSDVSPFTLGSFGDLNYGSNVKCRTAAWALLTRRDTRILSSQIDFRLNRMRADRAMCQALCVTFSEFFHMLDPLPLHRTQYPLQGLCQIRK